MQTVRSGLCLFALTFSITAAGGGPALTLTEALARAKQYSGQIATAAITARLAHEDKVQAQAAALPNISGLNQFIYTEGNHTPSGVFVANDGVHVYNEQLVAHEELLALLRRGEIHAAAAAEAVAKAKAAVAERGLQLTVVEDYYGLAVAERKAAIAQASLDSARQFLDLTQKQEGAGESAHADVIKAQLQVQQHERDLEDAQLAAQKAKLALAVLIFPTLTVDFSIVDDLGTPNAAEGVHAEGPNAAGAITVNANPDIQAAEAGVSAAKYGLNVAEYAYLPSLGLDVFYGIDANQFATRTDSPTAGTNRSTLPNFLLPYRQNLGYVAQATLTIPIWSWGAIHSKVEQAELKQRQAEIDLATTRKQVSAEIAAAQAELESARQQVESLHSSGELAAESLRLTLLRYQAGEATALEVVDAQTTAAQARNAEADGLLRDRVAQASVKALEGTL
jgi:outer membrane protein TolC